MYILGANMCILGAKMYMLGAATVTAFVPFFLRVELGEVEGFRGTETGFEQKMNQPS